MITMKTNLSAARAYLELLHKPVIPVCWAGHGDINQSHTANCSHKGKVPLIPAWQLYGEQHPTVEQETGRWKTWPQANIGGPTGLLWGIALDIDPRHGGDLEIEFRQLNIPDTVTALTGGGGVHHLFGHPGFPVHNRAALYPGVDIRGDRGLIVHPPSVHTSGRLYTWEVSSRPESTPVDSHPRGGFAPLAG